MTIKRAYSTIILKSVDEDQRIIEGLASTPSLDRMGDIVEPDGMEAKMPVPFLYQHDHSSPIGHVVSAKKTADGIVIRAELVRVDDPGALKDRLDMAWQSIKAGLVRGLSIGFRALESARIEGTWGYRYLSWELMEISAVTIPANAEASITAIKSFDRPHLAASGTKQMPVVRLDPKPAAAGALSTHSLKETPMNIAKQIENYQNARAAKVARMKQIMEISEKDGATLDAAQSEEFETIQGELDTIDKHLHRLEAVQKASLAEAKPVVTVENPQQASQHRLPAQVKANENLPKGIEFARFVMCLGAAKGVLPSALEIAKSRFPNSDRIVNVLKAAVAAGTTTDTTWAAPLVEYNQFAGDFVEYLRPQTIIGKFGVGNIPALREIPFNVHIRGETSGGSGYWVGEGKPTPLSKFDYNDVNLTWAKVANIAVLTQELLRFSNPSAEALVRDSLARALIARLDTDFVDPSKAAVANVSPASITNAATPIASTGNDADAIREDIRLLMSAFITANISPTTAVFIMKSKTALALSLLRNAFGQKEFPDITMNGGILEGVPVITSEYVPGVTAGDYVILANASDIWKADDGQVLVEASREASLQMLDNPTNASSDGTATSMVSMFQTDSVAIKAMRVINWKLRRSASVQVLNAVNWGEAA